VISQAALRQPYIDQGQSLNIMIHPNASIKDVNLLLIEAWKLGIKSLYYQRSTNPAQEFARNLLACVSCEA
jgi:ribonucleoside-diphosphate reductase alpha chain